MATLNTVTSSTRPSSPAAGEAYFETDTNKIIVWDGSAWTEIVSDTVPSFSNTYSVSLDGTNDHITLDSSISFSGACALSAWIKPTGDQNSDIFLGHYAGTTMYTELHNQSIVTRWGGSSVGSSGITVSNGSWYHVLINRDASNNVTLYINGVSRGTGSISASLTVSQLTDQTYCYGGFADEYAMWDSDQSSNISAIYNSGVPNDISSLSPLHWWRMGDNDSGTGTTITDQGSGGNDGTLTNGPTFSTDIPS